MICRLHVTSTRGEVFILTACIDWILFLFFGRETMYGNRYNYTLYIGYTYQLFKSWGITVAYIIYYRYNYIRPIIYRGNR